MKNWDTDNIMLNILVKPKNVLGFGFVSYYLDSWCLVALNYINFILDQNELLKYCFALV